MRRLFILLLTFALAACMAACGGEPKEYTESDMQAAIREANQQGYEAGLKVAQAEYGKGYDDGYDAAVSIYSKSIYIPNDFAEGYEVGYSEGYNVGWGDAEFEWKHHHDIN